MATVVGSWLLWVHGSKLSLLWMTAFGGSVITIWLAKLLFAASPVSIGTFHIHSPSGHAGVSATLYGMIALLFLVWARGFVRWVTVGSMAAAVAAVTVSRVALHAHSVIDALVGLALGLLWLLPMSIFLKNQQRQLRYFAPLAVALALVALSMHGLSFPTHRLNIVPEYRTAAASVTAVHF